MTREAAYEILKLSLQVVRGHGKIDKSTVEAMLTEIDSEFENEQNGAHENEWRKKSINTPYSSPVKKKRKHEVLNFDHIYSSNYT